MWNLQKLKGDKPEDENAEEKFSDEVNKLKKELEDKTEELSEKTQGTTRFLTVDCQFCFLAIKCI